MSMSFVEQYLMTRFLHPDTANRSDMERQDKCNYSQSGGFGGIASGPLFAKGIGLFPIII